MKTILQKTLLLSLLVLLPSIVMSQPPEPPVDPSAGGGPIGGGAPIGSGVALLLTLAATYGMKKLRDYYKKTGESIED
jgi:hypothetical protein